MYPPTWLKRCGENELLCTKPTCVPRVVCNRTPRGRNLREFPIPLASSREVCRKDARECKVKHNVSLRHLAFACRTQTTFGSEGNPTLTAPTGKPVGFWLPSVACNRTSFSDFGVTSVNLFESGLSLPSSPTTTLAVNFCLKAKEVQSISLILRC